jgi:hypothetical protein
MSTAEPLPYEEITDEEYAQRASVDNFVLEEPERGRPFLRGTCPRCGDPMIYPLPQGIILKGPSLRRLRSRRADSGVWPVLCTCTRNHPGRPPDNEGCGAFWSLHIGGASP